MENAQVKSLPPLRAWASSAPTSCSSSHFTLPRTKRPVNVAGSEVGLRQGRRLIWARWRFHRWTRQKVPRAKPMVLWPMALQPMALWPMAFWLTVMPQRTEMQSLLERTRTARSRDQERHKLLASKRYFSRHGHICKGIIKKIFGAWGNPKFTVSAILGEMPERRLLRSLNVLIYSLEAYSPGWVAGDRGVRCLL